MTPKNVIRLRDLLGGVYDAPDEVVGYANAWGDTLCSDCYEASLDDERDQYPIAVYLSNFQQFRYYCCACGELLV